MRIGQHNLYPQSVTFDAALRSRTGDGPTIDIEPFEEVAGTNTPTEASATGDTEADPIQAANEALAREFLEWAQKTPEEKIRERVLAAKGLDEDSLKALPKAEREAVEQEVREAVKQVFGVDSSFGMGSDEAATKALASQAI